MPSFVVHALLPPLLLLAARVETRKVLYLLPLALAADLDFFVGAHRATLTNVWIPLAVGAAAWWHHRRPGLSTRAAWLAVAFYYLASHLVMDAFVGGVVLFYPLTDTTYLIDASILVDTRTLEPIVEFAPAASPGIPTVTPLYQFLSPVEAAMLALSSVFGLGVLIWKKMMPIKY
ncbi:MAG: hypothetical protein ACT4PT_07280 [Methanobacteriota archaeon]